MRWTGTLIATGALALSLASSTVHAQTRTAFTPDDLLAMRSFAGGQAIAVSPNGRWVAYVLTDKDDDWNVQEPRPTGYVYVQPIGGAPAAPRALTSGAVHSAYPAWSPDGKRLAFVREERDSGREVIWDAEKDQITPV